MRPIHRQSQSQLGGRSLSLFRLPRIDHRHQEILMLRKIVLDCCGPFPPWQISGKQQIGFGAQAEMAARIKAREDRESQSHHNHGAGMPSATVDPPDQQMLSLHYRPRSWTGISDMTTRLYAVLLKSPRSATAKVSRNAAG